MGLRTFIHNIVTGTTEEVSAETVVSETVDSDKLEALVAEEFMINVAINLIANAVSKCEFKTYVRGTEVKKDEYFLWN